MSVSQEASNVSRGFKSISRLTRDPDNHELTIIYTAWLVASTLIILRRRNPISFTVHQLPEIPNFNMAVTTWKHALQIIADESGLETEEIIETDDNKFATLGINHILATAILSQIRGPNGEALPTDFFDRNPTVGAFRRYYDKRTGFKSIAARPPAPTKLARTSTPIPLSIVLQQNVASKLHTIFLLPDGSGSAMAYASLPPVHPSVCVIGMNSPYLRDASQYRCSVEQIASEWVAEIYRRQPQGPYILGGWSAGGYYSYEVAKRLIQDGHTVAKMILIDSPCRTNFESLPMEVIQFLASRNLIGNWGSSAPPDWLIEHFRSTLAAVAAYKPKPMPWAANMKTYLIWSRDGVLDQQALVGTGLDTSVKVSRFLLLGKSDLGPNGWDQLVPSDHVAIATTSGTHFTMVSEPHVSRFNQSPWVH